MIRELKKIQVKDVTFECLFVNDGSTDNSEHLVKKSLSSSKRKQDILLTLKKNEGKGSAIKKGIRKATGEYILIQDADMEYHPRYIPKLLQPIIDKKAEVVFGTRLQTIPKFSGELRRPRFVLHYVGNRMLSLITSMLFGAWITDMETGYKVFPKKAFAQKTLSANKFDIEPEIKRAKSALITAGAQSALLAGSGSSVFGIFANRETQQRAVNEIQLEPGWRIFDCVTVSRFEYNRALSF